MESRNVKFWLERNKGLLVPEIIEIGIVFIFLFYFFKVLLVIENIKIKIIPEKRTNCSDSFFICFNFYNFFKWMIYIYIYIINPIFLKEN